MAAGTPEFQEAVEEVMNIRIGSYNERRLQITTEKIQGAKTPQARNSNGSTHGLMSKSRDLQDHRQLAGLEDQV